MFIVERDPGESRNKFKFLLEWVIFEILHPDLFSLDKNTVSGDELWNA